jgi:hypothetical protein
MELIIKNVVKGFLGDIRYVYGSYNGVDFCAGWRNKKYKFHISADLNNREKGKLNEILKQKMLDSGLEVC